ncbi:hypothetical protein IGI04_017494 [Brassica rapa subsp. trilocularis]|uniref:E3 ubiquitin-protein ligase RMA n=1 Tax=Brassica rapa subsp. trilocularis TaxID=1813537 RepID=A0ABQ7MCN7_BRACM|nr:hypothetical protein IGI04_017494 [Brassica rapa subsp. trilocularis]
MLLLGVDVRQVPPGETHSPLIELSQLIIPSALPAGEEESKKCENGNKVIEEDSVREEKRVVEKSVGSEGSFFDCYVCLDLSKEPVVTNCGHLFCWSCLYRWLQVSEAKECPVCKGEVSVKTLTPIYGRGEKNKRVSGEGGSDKNKKIPSRPQARRVESLRTTLERSGYVGTEGIRQREPRTGETPARQFLSRVMTSRGVRAEQNQSSAPLVAAPLDDFRQMGAAIIQRQMMQAARLTVPFSPVLTAAERLEDAYLMRHTFDEQLNNVPSVGGEDRDSFSSIIGVMNSESQVDTAAEIDSMVTVSTSSSVRRPHENNGSRVSDVDSADSRPLRRRRLA